MSRSTGVFAVVLLAVWTAFSPSAAQVSLDTPIPVDPEVATGELENGLRYFIRTNARPENRAELRLVVNAGSILEDNGQRGLAHLLEHMAFNGTEHFEKQELVDYLESIGMEFGPSVNAYTSFDETVYMLQVPTDDAEVMATGFQILEDWAHGLSLEPGEVDQERGVVIEEWRLGRGASARIADEQLPVVFAGSRYAERLPIGSVDVLESFPHEELVRFYETWYRPDLMAVVAVGDFDPEAVEELIRTHFDRIPVPVTPLDRPSYEVPGHDDIRFAIASDPEASGSRVAVLAMQEPPTRRTVGDHRQALIESLASGMLNDRLAELTQQADPPFAFAGSGRGRLVRTRSVFQLTAVVPEDGHVRGMEAVLTEAERAARHGFTETELERQKLDLLRSREVTYNDRENQPSARFAGAYVSHFLTGAPIPGIPFEYQAAEALLPDITVGEVNAVAEANLDPANRVVMVSGIEKPGVELPSEDELRTVLASVTSAEIAPYEDAALDQPLVAELPEPGSVVREETIDAVGVTVWHLSNGAEVWIKPTDFKEDEIVFRASSPGGWSRAAPEDHESAAAAAVLARQGGVGEFSRIDLQKALAGKAVSVGPSIGETGESLSGNASPRDIETLFELTWLYFTAPRRDETAFEAFLSQNRTALQNRGASPLAAFSDTVRVTMAGHHPRIRPPAPESLDDIELDRALAFYRDRFASADDFTFFFVGALDPEAMRPLVEQYLAALPGTEREDGWVDLDIDPPESVVEKVVRRGIEPRSQTLVAFTGSFGYTPENRLRMRALAGVLQTRLRDLLREDLGGTYSVSANGGYDDEPEERYTFQIAFGSDPGRADELREAVFAEIERLKTDGPTQEEVDNVLETERRGKETSVEQNSWWATQLVHVARVGEDPTFLVEDDLYDAVTVESMREDARRYLRDDRYVVVVLLPEDVGG